MNCKQCNEVFDGRSGAKYCSAKCRKAANRDKTEAVSVTNVTDKISVTGTTVTDNLLPLPLNFGQSDCECRHCQNNRATGSRKVLNHGLTKTAGELADNELNRVALPSDVDYIGVAA